MLLLLMLEGCHVGWGRLEGVEMSAMRPSMRHGELGGEGRGGEVSWKRVNRIGGDPFQFVWEDCRFERNVEDLREEEKERESC